MENQKITKENEEISIIDILAVLIKNRKLIIMGTIIPTVITALWLFVAKPILKPVKLFVTENKIESTAVYTIKLNSPPPKVVEGIQSLWKVWDFNGRILFDFVNPAVMGAIYEKNQFADEVKEGEGEKYLHSFIEENSITCVNSVDTTYSLTIKMPIISKEKLDSYIHDFLEYEINLAYEYFLGKDEENLNLLINRYTRMLKEVENANPKTVNFDEIQRAKMILEEINLFKQQNQPFYEVLGKPVITTSTTTITPPTPPKEPKVKELIIVVVASLFIFIFIAFLLNAIQNIKDDPVSSQKIKDAWKEGK